MIENKSLDDREELHELCSLTYPMKEQGFIDYIFNNLYDENYGLVYKEEERIVSCAFQSECKIKMNHKILLTSFIYGIATHPDYRTQGYMDKLLKYVLERDNNNYLISLLETANPKIFKKYGFDVIGYRKKISVLDRDIKIANTSGVSFEYNVLELRKVYQQFCEYFGTTFIRDDKYFDSYIKMIEQSGGKLAVYRNADNKVMGYCVYYELEECVEIKEIVYLDSLALMKLLRFAIGMYPYIVLEVSDGERIEKLFDNVIPRKANYIMARVNSLSLFNKLYNVNARNNLEAIKYITKPVYINEKF